MVKTKFLASLLSFFILVPFNSNIDDKKIDKLVNNYILEVESATNEKSNRWYVAMSSIFYDIIKSEHTYDISNEKDKVIAPTYFKDVSKIEKDVFKVTIDKKEMKFYDNCIYFDRVSDRRYVFVELSKIIERERGRKNKVTQLLKIDVTSREYKIQDVLDLTRDNRSKYLNSCNINEEEIKKQEKIKKQTEALYEKVTEDYSNKNYTNTLITIDKILAINSNHTKAKEALDAVKKLITLESIENHYLSLLQNSDYDSCKKFLKIALKNSLINNSTYESFSRVIQKKITQKKQDFNFSQAEYFYENDMHKKALSIYLNLLNEGYKNQLLNSRIKTCKEADPKYVQNQLNIADKMGLKSKKNWLKSFKTYYKYEYSGLLRADQYFFMMIMMLDKKYSRVGKPMGFSRQQMETLAKKYFYEAKDRGYNVSYEENHIFTQSITKFRNNEK